jgi:hypothetical protein
MLPYNYKLEKPACFRMSPAEGVFQTRLWLWTAYQLLESNLTQLSKCDAMHHGVGVAIEAV